MERAEIYLNETLSALRAITERIPWDERLPGSPKLTEEMEYLLHKYLEQRKDLDRYKVALKELLETLGETEIVRPARVTKSVDVGAFVEVTPRNDRAGKFVAEVKAITSSGRYILWYGKYGIWDRAEFDVVV